MHEVSIARSIIGEIDRLISEGVVKGSPRAVRLRIGRLTTVVPETLDMMFSVVSEGTCLEGARLDVEVVPARAVCGGCGGSFELDRPVFLCPKCDGERIRIVSGSEMTIESVEVV